MALFVATKLKDQVITPLNGNPSAGDTVSIMPNNGSGKHYNYLSVSSVMSFHTFLESQRWVFDDWTGIPGVIRIATKSDPSLFLTCTLNANYHDIVTLEKKFVGTGRESERQLWRIVPGGGESNSVIQNYARGKALVLDVPWGTSAKPLQMWSLNGGSEQSFYIDIV